MIPIIEHNDNFTISKVVLAYYSKLLANTKPENNIRHHGLSLVISGSLKLKIDDATHVAQKGDIIIHRKGDIYNSESEDATEYIVISYLCDKEDILENLLPKGCIFRPTHRKRYVDLFERAASIHFSQGVCYEPLLKAVVQEIICSIVRENHPRSLSSANNPITAARYYIEEYSNRFITAEDIASVAGCSQSYLRYLFRQAYGESPMHYLNKVRVERAKEMIATNLYTLSEIATACGFRNVYYFSKVFKEFTGVSPGHY